MPSRPAGGMQLEGLESSGEPFQHLCRGTEGTQDGCEEGGAMYRAF